MDHNEVAKRFVERHPRGRAKGSNVHYEGDRFYSYATCVARWLNGRLLISSRKYSVTTSDHVSLVRRHASDWTSVYSVDDPHACFRHAKREIEEALKRLPDRRLASTRIADRQTIVNQREIAAEAAEAFGVPLPAFFIQPLDELLIANIPEPTLIKLARDRLLKEAA